MRMQWNIVKSLQHPLPNIPLAMCWIKQGRGDVLGIRTDSIGSPAFHEVTYRSTPLLRETNTQNPYFFGTERRATDSFQRGIQCETGIRFDSSQTARHVSRVKLVILDKSIVRKIAYLTRLPCLAGTIIEMTLLRHKK